MRTHEFMRYSAHVNRGASGSERPSCRGAAHADPGPVSATDDPRRAVAIAGARDRASEVAAGQAAPDAVWAQVGKTATADRAVGTAAGRVGIESSRARVQPTRTGSGYGLLDSSQTRAPCPARSSAAANADPYAERNRMSAMPRRVAEAGRRCFRDAGVRAWWFRCDSSCAHEAELHEMRLHCAGRSAEPTDCAGQGRAGAARARSGERSEEHTSELQSLRHLVCRLL